MGQRLGAATQELTSGQTSFSFVPSAMGALDLGHCSLLGPLYALGLVS